MATSSSTTQSSYQLFEESELTEMCGPVDTSASFHTFIARVRGKMALLRVILYTSIPDKPYSLLLLHWLARVAQGYRDSGRLTRLLDLPSSFKTAEELIEADARLHSRLTHKSLLTFLGVGLSSAKPAWLLFDLPSSSLSVYMVERRVLSVEEITAVLGDTLDALAFLHRNRVCDACMVASPPLLL